ncbi:hypothetical protein GA707_13855 [Nostocoides sp. F2B08]|uniref:DUF6603 domain-containing protein n=1 Tax=Nostocoides sp. F2B08 TaxID=2653936 RepID=UPI001262DD10|nr:DUF6603 domain-containing protein [Tetrasphaera sp. F2B08]KAB7743202.1 hypothetical protein GA707_13855 [Tetrasphaera sp. F2B08]
MGRDVSLINDLQKTVLHAAGNRPVTARLTAAITALANAPDNAVAASINEYRAALAEAAGKTQAELRELINELAAAPVAFLGPVHAAAGQLLDRATAHGTDLADSVELGPATLSLIAKAAAVRSLPTPPERPTTMVVGHLPIAGLAAALELGPISASGAGYFDVASRSAGAALTSELGPARVDVALLVDASGPLSVRALLRAEFRPTGIHLGFGFSLDAVGGIVGINCGVDGDRMRDGIADGSAMDALFGGGRSADQIRATVRALERIFLARDGSHVVGPTLRLGWLNVGGTSLAKVDVGVILELPRGRVLLPGRLVVEVPGPGVPLLHVRLDLLGEVDVAGKRLALDAALVNSYVLGGFSIAGTAAVRMAWGDHATMLATVGGFYPGFSPSPAVVPPQRRISIGLRNPIPVGLSITINGYAAVTAGTVQAGAHLSVSFKVPGASLNGSAGFDAIVQLSPLWFEAQVHGSVSIRALGQDLLSVNLKGTLTGPGPLVLTAEAYSRVLGVKVGGRKSFILSNEAGADRAPFDGLAGLVREELARAANVTGKGGADPDVVLAPRAADDAPLLAPNAELVWAQEAFPLDGPFQKAGGRTMASPAAVLVSPAVPRAGTVKRQLTTAAYTTITPANALTVPQFEDREAGWHLQCVSTRSSSSKTVDRSHRTIMLPKPTPLWRDSIHVEVPWSVAAALRSREAPAALAKGVGAAVVVDREKWASAEPGNPIADFHGSGAASHSAALLKPGGLALPAYALDPVVLP